MSGFTVDRSYFQANFPSNKLHGKTLGTGSRLAGFNAIFDYWDSLETLDSMEWLAYALATAWHETGGRMVPVREGFATSDAQAYERVTEYCRRKNISNYAARHSNGQSYYGRGYVQLTHGINYKTMGQHLSVGSRFYDAPDDVMRPDTGAEILIDGMIFGLFRPNKGRLSDYFNGQHQRWHGARDLINGDKNKQPNWADGKSIGTLVADYGRAFRGALIFA